MNPIKSINIIENNMIRSVRLSTMYLVDTDGNHYTIPQYIELIIARTVAECIEIGAK